MPKKSIKKKTVSGISWSAADVFLSQGVTFLVGIVLARLLTPAEYGLIGICTIFIVIFNGIIDSGFSSALIRKKDADREDYNTMFIVNMGLSLLMYAVLYFSAPLIAHFFERPELVDLVRVMGLILIIQALSIVQYTILSKRLDFKTKTKASLIAAISSGAIGIGCALAGMGVWSLVAQQISRYAIYTICLWIFNKWWPSIKFSMPSFRYMWGFGWKMMLSGLLDHTWKELYQVVVGKFYSPATLGQYSKAKEFGHIFSTNITAIIQRVSYPALSELQDDTPRMVAAYRKLIKTTMFITAVCMLFIGAVAEPLIYCLIGPKWHQAATFLPIISISLSLYPLHALNLNMLKVEGRSDIFLILEIVKKIISIGPLCLGIFVDIYWMLIGSVVSGIIAYFLNSYYTGKQLNYSSWMQIKDVAPSYGLGLLIAVSVYFFKYLPISNFIILPIQLVVGTGVFFFVCEKTQREEYKEVKSIVLNYVSKIKGRK